MQITQVAVTVHEKRNNPYEYGHYDCGVTLTADRGQTPDDTAIGILRTLARAHVLAECNGWEHDLHEERRVDSLCTQINSDVHRIRNASSFETADRYAQSCRKRIAELPDTLQEEWEGKLETALQEARAQIIKEDTVPDPDDDPDFDTCPGCGRELNSDGFCPHCQPEWSDGPTEGY
jgi:hypothetical protein